jgi:hypothetical protein
MTGKRSKRPHVTGVITTAADDPAVLSGSIHIVVTQSGHLSWIVGRLDLASRRMTFPSMGSLEAPPRGFEWLSECLLLAATESYDEGHVFPL